MLTAVFDSRRCALGHGMLWHPERGQAFWVDILGQRVLTTGAAWEFDAQVSALGWIDRDRLLVATESALQLLDLRSGGRTVVAALAADSAGSRSNDGRADPSGGFWIATMDKRAAEGGGTIRRLYRGELRVLVRGLTIPNAIAFAPDGMSASYADTRQQIVWRQRLGRDGWPVGAPTVFLDLREAGLNPDGAVFDTDGNLWLALWGAGRVACYGPDGRERARVALPAIQPTRPAFGGAGLDMLLVTTAAVGATGPDDGRCFKVTGLGVTGQAEHRVIL